MKQVNEKLVLMLMGRKIEKQQYLEEEGISIDRISEELYEMLAYMIETKNGDQLELSLYVLFMFEAWNESFVELLNQLLDCDWHTRHEDVAMLLQKLKHPSSIDVLYKTVPKVFPYLEYDEAFALAVKCIWALGDIGTEAALKRLNSLLSSENEIIVSNAKHQISRIESRNREIK